MNDRQLDPPEEPARNDPSDENIAEAIKYVKDNPDILFDMIAQSSFWDEHAMFLYDHSEQFQAEVARSQRVADKAQSLADDTARSQADEAAFERAELLRDSRNDR